jgi:hypothetical protein
MGMSLQTSDVPCEGAIEIQTSTAESIIWIWHEDQRWGKVTLLSSWGCLLKLPSFFLCSSKRSSSGSVDSSTMPLSNPGASGDEDSASKR